MRDGRAVEATVDPGRWLLETSDAGGTTGPLLAELGIGTNPNAGVTGSIGGANVSHVHIDGLLRSPTIQLDGQVLLQDGELVD